MVTYKIDLDLNCKSDNHSFNMLEHSFSSKLDWCCYILSIANIASKEIGALICSIKFLSIEVAVCL